MDWDPNLIRQRSCRSQSIGVGGWWSSKHRNTTGLGLRFADREYGRELVSPYYQMAKPARRRWFGSWKRILKKWKLFEATTTSARDVAPYDPCTYAQNFDRGSARLEPENLSRSFSAQFANPNGILRRLS